VARTRTTKKLAQRIDLNYFKRPTGLKRAKFWLSVGVPALALVWIAWHGFARDSRVYSSGRMSGAHAVLEAECAACHRQTAGAFSAKTSDAACLACHDAPLHHAAQHPASGCAACHTEHRGRVNLVAASSQSCAACHGDLQSASGATRYATHIKSLEDGHPEFAPPRGNLRRVWYPTAIQVNHAIHMKPIRRGPTGPTVQLECGNCHRQSAADPDLTYSDAHYRSAAASYEKERRFLSNPGVLQSVEPTSGRELMAPVKFRNACGACHSLSFDERFDFGAPHDKPEIVHAFLVAKFTEYIRAHPAELREARDPERELTGKAMPAKTHVYTTNEWIAKRVYDAEQLLWRKTCSQCHVMTYRSESRTPEEPPWLNESPADILTNPIFPAIPIAADQRRRLPHAKFDHDAHRGFSCVSCHEKALTSTGISDVLLPGIATCKTCHAPGQEHAESRCFECHTYHDWAKRQEVKATFTLPALRKTGN
jgi:transcription elongation factor Elf1